MNKFAYLSMFALAACSGGEPADDSATQESAVEGLKVYVLDCGRINIGDLSVFAQADEYAGRELLVADPCILVRHPDGDLMWDSGLPMAFNEAEDGVTADTFHLSVPVTISEQLEAIDMSVEDVDYFTVSHSHFDHIGNGNMFAGATFLVDSDERAHMFREEARADEQTFSLYNELENAETTEFDGDHDVFGDGAVMILEMPGHTPGHTSLLVNLANEGPVLFSGDMYHLEEARERRTVPKFNTSVEDTLASMDRFERIAEEKDARVVIQHSMSEFEALPKVPEYLD